MRVVYLVAVLVSLMCGQAWAQTEYSYNGHIYTLVPGEWYPAEQAAVDWGGKLVTINDAAEEQWLKATFGATSLYWIGLTDKDHEGTWSWVNGETVTYLNWATGEPNDDGVYWSADFAVMNWGTSGGWADVEPCKWTQYGIAEKLAPEPIAATLFLLGGGALAVIRRRKA